MNKKKQLKGGGEGLSILKHLYLNDYAEYTVKFHIHD